MRSVEDVSRVDAGHNTARRILHLWRAANAPCTVVVSRIPLARTDIGPLETAAVTRVMAAERLANGREISEFEREFANYIGVDHAIAVNSGTSALIALLAAHEIGVGDEVIMPALTFVGTANAIHACGATPVLVDVDADTWNIAPGKIETAISARTRAIVPVHLFGLIAPMDEIMDIAQRHGLAVIEDACEAVGASFRGTQAGALADAGVFGFYPNKLLTTGEGGMISTDSELLAAHCRAIANQGRTDSGFAGLPGYSFRTTELAAAIGRAQLGSLQRRMTERELLAEDYTCALAGATALTAPPTSIHGERSWFTYPVLLPRGADRAGLMAHLTSIGIETAAYFPAVHTLPGYDRQSRIAGPLTESEDLGERLLCLPFWPGLGTSMIEEIVQRITDWLRCGL